MKLLSTIRLPRTASKSLFVVNKWEEDVAVEDVVVTDEVMEDVVGVIHERRTNAGNSVLMYRVIRAGHKKGCCLVGEL